jgi:hypothetical protein
MKEQQTETNDVPAAEHSPQASPRKKRTFVMSPAAWFAAGGIALFVGAVGFVAGMQMNRLTGIVARNTTFNRTATGMRGQFNDDTFRAPAATVNGLSASGAITAVSATSITVKDTRTGQGVSFGITSNTSVTNANATASVSDLKVGDTVRVQTSSTTSTDAPLIELNPVARGRGMMGAY